MNACIESAMNYENLGARITENRALDQKIWALEAFRAKQSFYEVLGQFWNFWSDWRVLALFTGTLAKFLEWFRTYL
jgi:hypothetical protein